MGILTKKDTTMFRGYFKEMAKLRGINVSYQYPIKTEHTQYVEPITKLSKPERMDIVFEDNPKPKTLKAIGWVSEFGDDKPYIALLPYDAKNIGVDCVIMISPDDVLRTRYNRFKITGLQSIMEYPDCWTCTLAPIFETDDVNNNYNTTNYNYLKDGEQPQDEAYGDVMLNDSYSYIKVGD